MVIFINYHSVGVETLESFIAICWYLWKQGLIVFTRCIQDPLDIIGRAIQLLKD